MNIYDVLTDIILSKKLGQFENNLIHNNNLISKLEIKNNEYKQSIEDIVMMDMEIDLVEDIINKIKQESIFNFCDIYMDPALPASFHKLSVDDFYLFSCYIYDMIEKGNKKEDLYIKLNELYKNDKSAFLYKIRGFEVL